MGRLDGKIALITGSASGIGAACVDRFLAEGARVVATDVAPQQSSSDACLTLEHDVGDEAAWQAVLHRTTERFGGIDILVNNAGISARVPGPISEIALEDWRRVIGVNLDGVFLGIKHAMRAMSGRGGAIVNMGSVHSFVAIANSAAYCASKGGVLLLSKAAALEGAAMKPPVRVNSVHPGYVATPLVDARTKQRPGMRTVIEENTPLGRLARPEEIATVVLNLVTDDGSYVTGSAVTVDGGFTAR